MHNKSRRFTFVHTNSNKVLNGMETRYFKKDKGYIAWFMSIEKDESGFDVMIDDSGSMCSARKSSCQVIPSDYEPCSKEEFTSALDRAIAALTGNLLIAA